MHHSQSAIVVPWPPWQQPFKTGFLSERFTRGLVAGYATLIPLWRNFGEALPFTRKVDLAGSLASQCPVGVAATVSTMLDLPPERVATALRLALIRSLSGELGLAFTRRTTGTLVHFWRGSCADGFKSAQVQQREGLIVGSGNRSPPPSRKCRRILFSGCG